MFRRDTEKQEYACLGKIQKSKNMHVQERYRKARICMFRRDTKNQEYACLGEKQKNKRKGLGYISLSL